jgi:Bax protein
MFAFHYRGKRPLPPVWPIPEDPVAARKAQMINLLYPLIHRHNLHLLTERARLLTLQKRDAPLPQSDQAWLASLAQTYELPMPDNGAITPVWIGELLKRVDVIPADLALAQAASESAWGTSRFALQGNNYFGIWCFTAGCGLIPTERPTGASYEVQYFATVADNVDAYMLNLNSHASYQPLRDLRARLRAQHKPLKGKVLSKGLINYSGIGHDYIAQLRLLIRHNHLGRFNRLPTETKPASDAPVN